MLNEIQQAWTGVEKRDRALISRFVKQGHLALLISVCLLYFVHHYRKLNHLQAYFMSLPTPVLSDGDIVEVQSSSYESARLIWNTWSQDPIKAAVLQAILSCQARLFPYRGDFRAVISMALGQDRVCSLHYSSLEVEKVYDPNVFRIPPKLGITSLSWVHIPTPGGNINVQ